jgi:hypothetical protein
MKKKASKFQCKTCNPQCSDFRNGGADERLMFETVAVFKGCASHSGFNTSKSIPPPKKDLFFITGEEITHIQEDCIHPASLERECPKSCKYYDEFGDVVCGFHAKYILKKVLTRPAMSRERQIDLIEDAINWCKKEGDIMAGVEVGAALAYQNTVGKLQELKENGKTRKD